MTELLPESKEIVEKAIADIKPYAIIAMISGGNDSMAAYQVAKALGVRIDFIMHGRTGTGIPETTEFVREFARGEGLPYIEADAGDAYEEYVLRKGFFGRGQSAHSYAYHTLKAGPFRKALSHAVRKGQRNRNIVLLNGARIEESTNRANNMTSPIRSDGKNKNFWVNVIHHWSKVERDGFLSECNAPCNPVTKAMCRSGECLCGTAQDPMTKIEASVLYPKWGEWINNLQNRVYQNGFTWGWGDDIPKTWTLEKAGQSVMDFDEFTPMCVSCNVGE